MSADSISFLMPALNEQRYLAQSIEMVQSIAIDNSLEYELTIINDGSIDNTGIIADNHAKHNKHIKVIHHKETKGFGYCFKEGLKQASKDYFTHVTANNECKKESIEKIICNRGTADLIIPYPTNMSERPFLRRIISRRYTSILNVITGYGLNYYNGSVLYKTHQISSIEISTNSYAFHAEAVIKLLNSGKSYKQVPIEGSYQKEHKTKAFKVKNILAVFYFLIKLPTFFILSRNVVAK